MEARWGSNARGEGEEEKPSEKRWREGKRVGTASAFSFGRGRREERRSFERGRSVR